MKSKIFLSIVIVAALAGLVIWQWQSMPVVDKKAAAKAVDITAVINSRRPDFTLPDLQGKIHNVSDWDGKVLIVNFWATWCPPCRREMPAFVRLQEKYGSQGVQFVGIALDDKDQVQDFVDSMDVNYPILIGDRDAFELVKAYGDHLGALPHSAVVDRKGIITRVKSGELHESELETTIKKLL